MNNDAIKRALEQARDMQRTITEVLSEKQEAMKPLIERSLKTAQELQAEAARRAQESGLLTNEQTQHALGHLERALRSGADAVRAFAERNKAGGPDS